MAFNAGISPGKVGSPARRDRAYSDPWDLTSLAYSYDTASLPWLQTVQETLDSLKNKNLHRRAISSQSHYSPRSSRPLPTPPPSYTRRRSNAMANNNNNAFPSLDTSFNANNNRAGSISGSQVNGNGPGYATNYMAPLPVGHQQDLNYLYQQIQELSGVLQHNREKVNEITKTAEEVARRANLSNGNGDSECNGHLARIHELERELAKSNKLVELYKHEQTENTKLIGMYEEAVGNMTEQIRNYTNEIDGRFLSQRRHYNDLLQQEKDEHLQTRLDRDHWNAQTLRVCEMIRTANRLRTDEWCEEYAVISGLQSQVRCLRRCMGLEAENPEDEVGWPYLKDLPLNDQA